GDEAGRQVIVSGPVEKHELIKQALDQIDSALAGEKADVKVYTIIHGDAASVASAVATAIGTSATSGGSRGQRSSAQVTSALRITYEATSNTVVVRASESQHKEVESLVAKLDIPAIAEAPRTITLANAEATTLAGMLSRLFAAGSASSGRGPTTTAKRGQVIIEADSSAEMLIVRADEATFEKIKTLATKLDLATPIGQGVPTVIKLTNARAASVAPMLSQAFAPQRGQRSTGDDLVVVIAEPASNSIIVTASARKLDDVKKFVTKLDTELASISRTEMIILKNTVASQVAAVLSQVAAGPGNVSSPRGKTASPASPVLVTSAAGANALIITGPEKDLSKLMTMALDLDKAGGQLVPMVKLYTLTNADPAAMVVQLEKIFPATAAGRGRVATTAKDAPVTVVADETGKRVIVSAPPQKHELIAQVIKDIDESHDADKITVEVYKIENADAASMASGLSGAWAKGATSGRGKTSSTDAVRITADRGSNSIIIRAPARDHIELAQLIKTMDLSPQDKYPIQHIPLNNADATNVASVLASVYGASAGGGRGSRTATAGSSVVISPDPDSRMLIVRADAETFKKIRSMALLMDAAPSGKMIPTIIPVKDGNADSLATALTKAFSPKRGVKQSPNDIVTIVAEPTSDSLIVTANAENLEKINKLVEEFA
ncbi:MAG TPA: hypothetical protein ENL03_00300, partial [Phycisphaerae bacterium]|nr:hypothetical protein [Phycisphaerae bacterium]